MAVHLRDNIIIHRPVEEVFRALNDIDRMATITPVPTEIKGIERLPNGGNRVRFMTQGRGGKWCEALSEHIEYIPLRRVVIRGETEGVTTMATREFEPVEGGTRLVVEVTYSVHVHVPLLSSLIEFQWRRQSRQSLRQMLERIKAELEGVTAI